MANTLTLIISFNMAIAFLIAIYGVGRFRATEATKKASRFVAASLAAISMAVFLTCGYLIVSFQSIAPISNDPFGISTLFFVFVTLAIFVVNIIVTAVAMIHSKLTIK